MKDNELHFAGSRARVMKNPLYLTTKELADAASD